MEAYQQNTRDRRENLRCRRDRRKQEHNNQKKKKKFKMQKPPIPKHPGNLGHNEKTKPKDNRYRFSI
jgi:hypothetical protein